MAPRLRVMIVGHGGPLMHCAAAAKAMRVRRVRVLWLVQSTGEIIVHPLSSKGVRYASAGRDIGKHFIFTIRAVEPSMSALPPKAYMCSATYALSIALRCATRLSFRRPSIFSATRCHIWWPLLSPRSFSDSAVLLARGTDPLRWSASK